MAVQYAAFVRGDSESIRTRNKQRLFTHLPVLDPQTPQFRSKLSFYIMSVEKGRVLLLILFFFMGMSKRRWKCGSSVIFGLRTRVPQ